jgi:GrpB-like predicted nucleotidyltransferase (UPF0157 family)
VTGERALRQAQDDETAADPLAESSNPQTHAHPQTLSPLVVPYDPEWPRLFAEIRAVIERNISGKFHAIEHVGSTSVPGMTAKPIIDIDVAVRTGQFDVVRQRLEALGYEYEGEKGIPGRHSFRLRDASLSGALARHHLYVLEADAEELRRNRAFRDYLRAHPEEAARLSAHKRELAERLALSLDDDRYAYQEAKSAMVLAILEQALTWYETSNFQLQTSNRGTDA